MSQLKSEIKALNTKQVPQAKQDVAVKSSDLLFRIIQIGHDQKLPCMQKLLSEFDRVEKRAGVIVHNHLNFGNDVNVVIKY